MALTSRAMRVVKRLLEGEGPLTVRALAECVHASERAVRYDFEAVGFWLRDYGLALAHKPGLGVWVEGAPADRARALSDIVDSQPQHFPTVVMADDRIWSILGWVLSSREPVPVDFLTHVLGISKRTIFNDLKRLRTWLSERGMALRHQRGQISVMADEARYRKLMAEFLERCVGNDTLGNMISLVRDRSALALLSHTEPSMSGSLRRLLEDLGGHEVIWKIGSILTTAQTTFRIKIPTTLAGALAAHLLVMLSRVRQGQVSPTVPGSLPRLRSRPEWAVAAWITSALQELFAITLPEGETANIAQYLSSATRETGHGLAVGTLVALSQEELGLCARAIARGVSDRLGVDLMEDVELRAGLVGHLYGSLEKVRAGLPIENPLLPDIQRRFPRLYDAVLSAAKEMGALFGLTIPEPEAGWLAFHVAAALERLGRSRTAWRGVVACPSGLGVAQLLRSRLATEFPQSDLRTVSALDEAQLWDTARSFGARVVVSTVRLGNGPVPTVVVSPFLTPADIARIISVVSTATPEDEEALLRTCRTRLAEHRRHENLGPCLGDLVREDQIELNINAADAAAAIRATGNILERSGCVSAAYADAMVDQYAQFGPYMVLVPGVAVPHASPDDGVMSLGLSVVTLRQPVCFGSPQYDPVDVVIAFASPDNSLHWRALAELLERLQDGAAEALRSATGVDAAAAALRRGATRG